MQKLTRSTKDRKISGVCGGLAQYLRVDSNAIRLIWIILIAITGIIPFMLIYVIAAIIIPADDEIIKI